MNLNRVVGLVLMFGALAAHAEAFEQCTNLAGGWVAGVNELEPTLHDMACVPLKNEAVGGANLRVVDNGNELTAEAMVWAGEILAPATKALGKYLEFSPSLELHNVSFLLASHDPAGVNALATAGQSKSSKECLIVIRTTSGSIKRDAEDAEQRTALLNETVAHELVHCLQRWNVPAQMQVSNANRNWWSEGSAEFLANTVYPTESELTEDDVLFSAHIEPMTTLSYGMIVFFAWYAKNDPSLIFSFWQSMPTVEGQAAQQAALLTVVDAQELQVFAQQYVDQQISLATHTFQTAEIPQLLFDHEGEQVAQAEAFTLQRRRLVVKGGEYSLSETTDGTPEAKFKVSGVWGAMPGKAGNWCGVAEIIPFANVPVTDQMITFNGSLTTKPASVDCSMMCGPLPEANPCLVGEWVLDAAGVEKRVDQQLGNNTNPKATVNGTTTLTLGKDGANASFVYDEFNIFVGAVGDPDVFYDLTVNGKISGSWSTGKAGDPTFRLCPTENTTEITAEVQIFDGMTNPKAKTTLDSNEIANMTYSCVGASLELTAVGVTDQSGGALTWVFHRKPGTGIVAANACATTPAALLALSALGLLLRRRRSPHK